GAAAGVEELRSLAGAPRWEPPELSDEIAISDLDRAIDVLVEMKNVSEVAVGLAYSALVLRDGGLAAEVNHLEDRLDEMKERLELWVLRAAAEAKDPSTLRGLIHLGAAAEEIGDAAQQMVWLVEEGEELHPILAIALGDADEVVVRVPVAAGSSADGSSLAGLQLETETGFYLLAIRRGGRYLYRPRRDAVLHAADELIATGPDEGHTLLAEMCGYRLIPDDDTGAHELVPAWLSRR
ncbi:MAG: potassium channel family protein, partial [Pseudonocardiaceae bacterium]